MQTAESDFRTDRGRISSQGLPHQGESSTWSASEVIPPRLAARRGERGVVVVEIAGDWLGRTTLPDVGPLRERARGRRRERLGV